MVVVEEIVPGDISHGWTPCQDEELTQRMKGELDVLREQMAELGAMSDGKPPFPVGR